MSRVLEWPPSKFGGDEAVRQYRWFNVQLGTLVGFLFFWIALWAPLIAAALFGALSVYFLRFLWRWKSRENFAYDMQAQAAIARRLADGKEKYISHLSNLVTESAAKALYFEAWVRLTPEARRLHQDAIGAEAERLRAEHDAMRRQLLTPLLWLFVLVVGGIVESLQAALRLVATLGFRSVLAVATLVVLWRSDNLPAQLSAHVVWPIRHAITVAGASVVMVAVLYRGLRSSARRRLWRWLRSRVLAG